MLPGLLVESSLAFSSNANCSAAPSGTYLSRTRSTLTLQGHISEEVSSSERHDQPTLGKGTLPKSHEMQILSTHYESALPHRERASRLARDRELQLLEPKSFECRVRSRLCTALLLASFRFTTDCRVQLRVLKITHTRCSIGGVVNS